MGEPDLTRGLELFDQRRFFDAHEALEDLWREAVGPERRFLQGLIQVAVGLHHYSTGNIAGARSLVKRGEAKLAEYPEVFLGLDVHELRQAIHTWLAAVERGQPPSPLPRLARKSGTMPALVTRSTTAQESARAAVEQVPLLDLTRQYAHIRTEVMAAIERVCSSQHFILGEEVRSLERELASYCAASSAVGCASGTDALWLMLLAAGVEPGDEVITTPFSFFASTSAILRAGARPVYADIDPRTLNLDPEAVEQRIQRQPSAKLKCVLIVHLYGQCANMDQFLRLGTQYKLTVLEDAAQAIGAGWRGRRAGSLGAAAAFSFYPTKNLGAYGDAGCVTTVDPGVAEQVRLLRHHGSRERYFHEALGWNSRLDALQAAILRVKLKHLEKWNAERRQRAATYDRLFQEAGLGMPGAAPGESPSHPVALPYTQPEAHHVFHQYVIRAKRRDELRAYLAKRGVGTEIYYPLPLHLQKCLTYLGHGDGNFPEAERAAKEVLALPMFPELTEAEQAYVVDTIADFFS
ncbi:MAG TPA: aminotransferase class I/II-fold pyridoxal phosphate-dependent enzyme [Terriglobales bacterium]|nr:aminotransferase class I/II-fold pyridoxal phosphate-dependent enzyme [Terriglobales bacterium]